MHNASYDISYCIFMLILYFII